VSYKAETPFDSIESAHTYLGLLVETAREAREAVDTDAALVRDSADERRAAVLHLVAYNLDKLESHVKVSRRILNDLRTLRRLLLEERSSAPAAITPRASQITESRTSNYA
jgi:hypothetical protein